MRTITGNAYWAFIRKPHPNTKKLQMDIGNLDEETVSHLKELGVKVLNNNDERGNYITAATKNPKFAPKVVDSKLVPFPEPARINNGSKIKMAFKTYTTEYMKETFVKVSLSDIQVLEYKEFSVFEVEDGFSVEDLSHPVTEEVSEGQKESETLTEDESPV